MLGCLGGCAGASGAVRAAPAPTAGDGAAFAAWESRWLEDLGATDPRLALRLPVRPAAEALERVAVEAVVQGDKDLVVFGGAIDPFSFTARRRRLRALRDELGRVPDDGLLASRDEKALLTRLLDGEDLRLASEDASPELASERVRAIVATWGHPASPREVDEREHEVEHGLHAVLESAAAGKLQGPRATELEDALDPLERLAPSEGYPDATRLITALRVELGKLHPQATASSAPPPLAARLDVYLGFRQDARALRARLEQEEVALRSEAKARLAGMPEQAVTQALAAAAVHVDAESSCATPRGPSPVRSMRPPPERALVCEALRLVAGADLPLDRVVATVAVHDDVAIALWAIEVDGGTTDLDAARAAHPLMASVSSDRQDRLVRDALVSPARAIAAGLACALLDAGGADARRERASRWLAFGDAPLDAVADYLGRVGQ
jgi:hypothetical protein